MGGGGGSGSGGRGAMPKAVGGVWSWLQRPLSFYDDRWWKTSTMAAAVDYVKNYNQPDVVVELMCSGDGGNRCGSGNGCQKRRRRWDDNKTTTTTPRWQDDDDNEMTTTMTWQWQRRQQRQKQWQHDNNDEMTIDDEMAINDKTTKIGEMTINKETMTRRGRRQQDKDNETMESSPQRRHQPPTTAGSRSPTTGEKIEEGWA
jgi:hypothetical protein